MKSRIILILMVLISIVAAIDIYLYTRANAKIGFPFEPLRNAFKIVKSTSPTVPPYQELKDIRTINFTPDPTVTRTHTVFGNLTVKTPNYWYIQPNEKEADTVTFGTGILSFLTIRHGKGQEYISQRVEKIKSSRRVTKEIINLNGKQYETYAVKSEWYDDYGVPGYRDWYYIVGDDVYLISTPGEDLDSDYTSKIDSGIITDDTFYTTISSLEIK